MVDGLHGRYAHCKLTTIRLFIRDTSTEYWTSWRSTTYISKPEKSVFTQRCIKFLGVVLEGNMIQMDPTKIKGVAEWPQPRNPTDIRSFLGFTGFYRYFIPNYSRVAQPLLDLTKKAMPWIWTKAQTIAFEMLKKLMCSKPVLTQPQYDKTVHSTYGRIGIWRGHHTLTGGRC